MPYLTEIKESSDKVYALEARADGFWTGPMGDCALVIFLWDPAGTRYGAGRGQHCSGGIAAAQVDQLIDGLAGQANVMMVIVLGSSQDSHTLGMSKDMLKRLETICRENNWPIRQFKADASPSAVTRTGEYMTKAAYDQGAKVGQDNQAPSRCCVMM